MGRRCTVGWCKGWYFETVTPQILRVVLPVAVVRLTAAEGCTENEILCYCDNLLDSIYRYISCGLCVLCYDYSSASLVILEETNVLFLKVFWIFQIGVVTLFFRGSNWNFGNWAKFKCYYFNLILDCFTVFGKIIGRLC